MPTTSRELLSGIIDYAGLFPPAKLPMDEAFGRFIRHRSSRDGWLLARFVCPAARLDELSPILENTDPGQETPIRIAALGSGGDDPPTFADALETDITAMNGYICRHDETSLIDVFETRLPIHGDSASAVDFALDQIGEKLTPGNRTFFELSLLDDWESRFESGATAIAAASHEIDPNRRAGLKIRCGGVDASAVPSVEAVATAIIIARDAALLLKATQGLHHPFRHHDESLGAEVHGFLNLVTATILARAHDLDLRTVREIIADQNPRSFSVSETALRWRDLESRFEDVVDGRLTAFTGFGSCSFSEPRDDLAALGLI